MRRRTVVLLAIIVILISVGAFIYVQRTAPSLPIGGLGLSPTDFLGVWINVKDMACQCQAEQAIINGLEISENQGTYTIYVVISGEGSTVILTVNPPNAHAFVIFQAQGGLSINADLTLQLLNSTFMQVKESIDYASNLSTTSLLATEQFVKWSGSFSTQSTASQTKE
ncbi:MAG: hypothetical protein ABSC50_00975 [Candidatus Bathyarchaeia archaeon]